MPTAIRHRYKSTISRGQILELLEQQGYKCALTGWDLTPETASIDHIVPLSREGQHEIGNAQILHQNVNRAKGALTNDEFLQLCLAVAQRADL